MIFTWIKGLLIALILIEKGNANKFKACSAVCGKYIPPIADNQFDDRLIMDQNVALSSTSQKILQENVGLQARAFCNCYGCELPFQIGGCEPCCKPTVPPPPPHQGLCNCFGCDLPFQVGGCEPCCHSTPTSPTPPTPPPPTPPPPTPPPPTPPPPTRPPLTNPPPTLPPTTTSKPTVASGRCCWCGVNENDICCKEDDCETKPIESESLEK